MHKQMVLTAGHDDTIRTLIYSGRPLHVRRTPYVVDWYVHSLGTRDVSPGTIHRSYMYRETNRREEITELTSQGKIPHEAELEKHPEKFMEGRRCESTVIELYQLLTTPAPSSPHGQNCRIHSRECFYLSTLNPH